MRNTQNLYWLADRPFLDTFCARFLHLCPQVIDGGEVTGINARFRGERSRRPLGFDLTLLSWREADLVACSPQSTATSPVPSIVLTSTVLGPRVVLTPLR